MGLQSARMGGTGPGARAPRCCRPGVYRLLPRAVLRRASSSASNRLMRASQRSGTGLGASRSNASRIVLPIRSMTMDQRSVMPGKLLDRRTVPDKKLDPPGAKHFELCLNRAAVT